MLLSHKYRFWAAGGIAAFLLLTAVPLLLGFLYALLYSLGLVGALAPGFTLRFWAEGFQSWALWHSLGYSLYITLASLLPAFVGGLVLATTLRAYLQKGPGAYLMYLPLVMPALVVALWSMQVLGQTGLVARLGFQWGWFSDMRHFPGYINDDWGLGILFAHWTMALPFFTLLFLGMQDNERLDDLTQVARSLGASPAQAYYRVVLPVLLQKGRPSMLMYGIFLWGAYEIPLLLGQQSPQMISVLITRKVGRYDLAEIPEGYFIAVLYSLLLLGVLFFTKHLSPSK